MASIKEVEDWISKGTYPHVARTSDPLIVRVSRFSLLVNDTNFYAKVKNGLGYKGYLIYSSGLGTPILEESATNETEFFSNAAFKKAISDKGTITDNKYDKFYESAEKVLGVLQDAAQSWLDTIELEIAKQPNDNAIKKAIDRLCWQLHYDITQSSTDFPEVFKDNDFGDVEIDWQENDTWNGKTVNESVFNNYTAISTSVTDGSSTISGGSSLQGVKSSISSFDGNLCGKFESFNGKFDTFDNHFTAFDTGLNGSLKTIGTKLVPDNTTTNEYYSISECLRDAKEGSTEKAYSIAKSLRDMEKSDTSVSNQIKLQMISLQDDLGENGKINTSLSTINTSVGTVNTTLGTSNTKLDTINGSIGTTNTNLVTINGSIGTSNNTLTSINGNLYDSGGARSVASLAYSINATLAGVHGNISGKEYIRVYNSTTTW